MQQGQRPAAMTRPYVFIGSSTEGLPIALAVQHNLEDVCEPELWKEIFDVGQVTFDALASKLPLFDFAVLVVTGDDLTVSREESSSSPRDNVILELGLAIGAIGGDRTFIVYERTKRPKLPSDLAGVTAATFQPPTHGDWRTALRPACSQIAAVIDKLGTRAGRPCGRHSGEVPRSDAGIVPSGVFAANRSGFVDENFAIQLLSEPVKLKRQDGRLRVTIDRRNVTEVVISDAGKTAVCRRHVFGREKELLAEDGRIQRFIVDTADGEMDVDPRKLGLRLRWASGGVLSIVRFRGGEYVPLFFRDIRPYGWNISLGSSERQFVNGTASDPEDEWRDPQRFVTREFLEESLVIDRDPAASPVALKLFTAEAQMDTTISDKFVTEHADQREEEDGLVIQGGDAALSLPVVFEPANSDIETTPYTILRPPRSKDMLACFSLLDLGIEAVRIARYSLGDHDYMLDGEILKRGEQRTKELVRMPIALFRCDYLARTFGRNDDWYRYTPGVMPSIKVSRPPAGREVHLFPYDVERRMEIIQGKNLRKPPTAWQIQRFTDWYDKFGACFLRETGAPGAARLPGLFVPGTAKILNQYFSLSGVFERYTRG